MSILSELKRRNVFKVGAAYLALAWVITEVTGVIVPALNLPASLVPMVVWLGVIGFPCVLIFSWVYELTPEGLKRESEIDRSQSITHITSRRLDYLIIALMVVAIGLFAFHEFRPARPAESAVGVGPGRDFAVAGAPHGRDAEAQVARAQGDGRGHDPLLQETVPSDKSIAVLPFVNMSSDKDQAYFADGISEELLNLLAKIPELEVIARTSSFAFKGEKLGIADIAKKLNVAHILEGSVRKAGNKVRITAQLIRASDSTHLWSETYDRSLEDIFAVQDEIASAVVGQLKITLLGKEPKARTTDPEAYALYMQAVQLGRQSTAEAFRQSGALYRQALAIDPRYAPAWTGLAENFDLETSQGMHSNKEGMAQSREAAMKALAIDPEYAPAHAELGNLAQSESDLAGAAQHFERALALDPTDMDILRRDPVNIRALFNLGAYQRNAGRFDAAIATLRTVLSLAPGRGLARSELGTALLLKGDALGALGEMQQETSEMWKMIGLPMVYHALGRKADSDAALTALIAKAEKDAPYNIAHDYAFCGNADKAFEWLDKAVEYGDPGIADIVTENLFDKIHADSRWLPFLRKIGKAPEQLAAIKFKVKLPRQ